IQPREPQDRNQGRRRDVALPRLTAEERHQNPPRHNEANQNEAGLDETGQNDAQPPTPSPHVVEGSSVEAGTQERRSKPCRDTFYKKRIRKNIASSNDAGSASEFRRARQRQHNNPILRGPPPASNGHPDHQLLL